MMPPTKYQGSRPCGFRQEDFSYFSLYEPMLSSRPCGFSEKNIFKVFILKIYF